MEVVLSFSPASISTDVLGDGTTLVIEAPRGIIAQRGIYSNVGLVQVLDPFDTIIHRIL